MTMDPARWQALNDLFHLALDRPRADRARFLDEACSGDAALREEAAGLLRAHDDAEGFLVTEGNEDRPWLGRTVGAYTLVEQIGAGGMGAVYLAERTDRQYEKRVAIKLIKRGMDTDDVIRRFRAERQILATLDHPNIARLLDGGATDDGLPYVVMEYVEGERIDRYCEARRLPVTTRLELFRGVCAAVSYAHQRLVVHRDLKPSNILVGADGTPKLLDFGIARILRADDPEATATRGALRPMTPEYASPEQAGGDRVTTLADVYSLGVVLYELLCGRLPYDLPSRDADEVARALATTEPRPPSEAATRLDASAAAHEGGPHGLRRRLRGDLDTIVLTAMQREPERRYPSVERLSEDLRRHLAGLPVLARRDNFTYRTSRFLRRNRTLVLAAGLAVCTLLGGLAVATWQARRARAQEKIARDAQARAERRSAEVRALARSLVFDYHDAIKDLPGAVTVRARLVQDSLRYLDGLAAEAAGDASLQTELAGAYERIGDAQGGTTAANLGDTAGAISSYRKAVALRAALAGGADSPPDAVAAAARSHRNLGMLLWETGDMAGTGSHFNKALSLFEEASRAAPHDAGLRFEVAMVLDRLAQLQQDHGDTPGALGVLARARGLLEGLPEVERETPKVRSALATVYDHEGMGLLDAGETARALEKHDAAFALLTALTSEFPLNTTYRRAFHACVYRRGQALATLGRRQEALAAFRFNLEAAEQDLRSDPKNEESSSGVAYSLVRVADMEHELGRTATAIPLYRRAAAIRAADVNVDPANLWKRVALVEARGKLASLLARIAPRDVAAADIAETVALIEQTKVERDNAWYRIFFADVYADMGAGRLRLAGRAPRASAESRAHARAACDVLERSRAIWDDMRALGPLSGSDLGKPEAVEKDLARCRAMAGGAAVAHTSP